MTLDDSVQALLSEKESVIENFYERFLRKNPEAEHHFRGVDLRQQSVMLTMALVTVENHYAHRYPATEHYLHVLGHRHHLGNIPPKLFNEFRDCLLETLAEFHTNDWDNHLASEWKKALDATIRTMLEGYRQAYIY
ncbi:MAG: hypothetical protein Tsb009_38540 [Planctomycetaceae bacterium]